MIDVKQIIYAALDDSSLPNLSINKVEPSTSSYVDIQSVSESLSKIGFTSYSIYSQVAINASVINESNYSTDLDVLVNVIKTKLLTSQAIISQFEVESLKVVYEYREAGDSNIAVASIVLSLNYSETIEPIQSTLLNKIVFNIDKDANDSIESSFQVDLNNQ